jgi:hypothetical protein
MERGASQMMVGVETMIPPSTISLLERRKLPIYPKYQMKLAEYYGTTPEELIDGSGFAREVGDE